MKNKRHSTSSYKKTKEDMMKLFHVFYNTERPLPLKVGIINDIYESEAFKNSGLTKSEVKWFMRIWVNRYEYHKSIAEGYYPFRYNLDGIAWEVIKDVHVNHSKKIIDIHANYSTKTSVKNERNTNNEKP